MPMTTSAEVPSQFYTGLVAELYEPLVSQRSRAEDYVAFLERVGMPALELACGSGLPLLDLVARGFEVEGLDASQDMLDICRARARERGLETVLHHAEMQSFSLSRRYRSVFIAGASFTLLVNDAEARKTLACIHEHLLPGGAVLITLDRPEPAALQRALGRYREVEGGSGERLRVALVALETSADGRDLRRRLRYERIPTRGEPEVLERDWCTRSWSQVQFREMLEEAGFVGVRFVAPEGGEASPDAPLFVALARRES